MALATPDDVAAALRRDLTSSEEEGLESLLDEASDLVAGYLHPCPIPDPTPAAITRVVAAMAAALLTRTSIPEGATSIAAGPFSVGLSERAGSASPWLTAALKQRPAPFRCGNGMVSVAMVSERFAP